MPFVAINLSNDYEVANKTRYATQEELTPGPARS